MIEASILRAMLAAGATAEMIVVAVEAAIESDRAKWRERKMSQRQGGVSQRKEKVSHTLPKENSSPVCSTNKPSPLAVDTNLSRAEPLFEGFWEVYPKKVGKGAARKAHRHALKRASHAEILAGAKRYAASKPDPQFTAHASTWLNADRWLDEPDRKPQSNVVGFRKELPPEPPRKPRTPEEQAEIDAKLARLLKAKKL